MFNPIQASDASNARVPISSTVKCQESDVYALLKLLKSMRLRLRAKVPEAHREGGVLEDDSIANRRRNEERHADE